MDTNPFEESKKLLKGYDAEKFTQNPVEFSKKMEERLMEAINDKPKEQELEEIKKPDTPEEIPPHKIVGSPEYYEERYNRLLLTTYHDGNVTYMNGQDLDPTDDNEIEMRKQILNTLYINLAVCYMKLKHFDLAKKVLKDLFKLKGENSLYCYWMACARACNLNSDLEQLNLAKQEILKANILKDTETMYVQNDRHVLDIAGLGNYKEAYNELILFVEQRI